MRRHLRTLTAAALVFCASSVAPRVARAGDSAQTFIQSRQTEVSSILKQPTNASRDKAVAGVLEGMLDYGELARRSLAQHWDDLNDAQRKDFSDVLRRLVQRNYEKNIKGILDYEVAFLGEESQGEVIVVHSKATSKTNAREEPVSIDYRVASVGTGYRVVDIVTEGSSLVANYKTQFHKVIQKDGFDALMKRMREKLAKGSDSV